MLGGPAVRRDNAPNRATALARKPETAALDIPYQARHTCRMDGPLGSIANAAPAIAMLGCFACLIGGGALIARGGDRRKGVLLLVMAAVLLGNVVIWQL